MGLFVREERLRGLMDLCVWRWRGLLDLLLDKQTGVSQTNTTGTKNPSVSVRRAKKVTPTAFFIFFVLKTLHPLPSWLPALHFFQLVVSFLYVTVTFALS